MRSSLIGCTLGALLTAFLASPVSAVPTLKVRSDGYTSTYYQWISVTDSSMDYSSYTLVPSEYPSVDGVQIDVCLVKFSDGTYRVGYFDPTTTFTCTVVQNGKEFDATTSDSSCNLYFLSIASDCDYYWAKYSELSNYNDNQVVYAPDHECVVGEYCWTNGYTQNSYTPYTGSSSNRWSNNQPDRRRRSWTRSLGRRSDGYSASEYCAIGYGSSHTDYMIYYAEGGSAYQSADVRTSSSAKVLIVTTSGSSSSSSSSGSSGSGSSGSGWSGSDSSGSSSNGSSA